MFTYLNAHNTLQDRYYHYCHFTNEEPEALSRQPPKMKLQTAEARFEPELWPPSSCPQLF